MMTPQEREPVMAWSHDLGKEVRRAWSLFGGPSKKNDRDDERDDDDDDLPRPNAVLGLLPFLRLTSAMPA